MKTLCSYKIDCIVVRDRWAGVPRKIADVSGVSVIDAGDGKHQHPTQALLDLYSIWEEKGSFDNLHVGVVGDNLPLPRVRLAYPGAQDHGLRGDGHRRAADAAARAPPTSSAPTT